MDLSIKTWTQLFVCIHVCSRIALIHCLHVSLHRLWISLLIEFSSKTIKQNTAKNKFIRYLCFIAADFIHSCHHCFKMSSFSLEKNRFRRSIDLTCWQSTYKPLRFLTALNTSSWRIFGPKMTEVTLNIIHPFKYPGLRVMLPNRRKIHSPTVRQVYLPRWQSWCA